MSKCLHLTYAGQPEETFTISEVVEKIGLGKFQILLILMAGFINVSKRKHLVQHNIVKDMRM